MKKSPIKILSAISLCAFISACNSIPDLGMEKPLSNISESDLIEKLSNYEFIPKEAYDMNLKTLSYEEFGILGHGYDMSTNYATQDGVSNGPAVIDIEKLKNNFDKEWLYISTEHQTDQEVLIGETAKDFINLYRNKGGSFEHAPVYGKLVSNKFYDSRGPKSNEYSSKDLYASLEIKNIVKSINFVGVEEGYNSAFLSEIRNKYLSPTFVNFLIGSSPQAIVQNFGTHVLVNIKVGAAFELNWRGQTLEPNRKLQAESGIQIASRKVGSHNILEDPLSEERNEKNHSTMITYRARGGNISVPITNGIIDLNNPMDHTFHLENWFNSVTDENSVIIDLNDNGVIPIYEFISDPIKRELVKAYVENYLNVNAVFQMDEKSTIYRYYSDKAFNHYYTQGNEIEDLTTYSDGLLAFQAYSYRAPNTFPVYRYYNKNLMNHYYVLEKGETIPSYPGYDLERIAFYAYDSPGINRNPIYRAYGYREGKRNHFYTKNYQEYLDILKTEPYKGEDIFFYAH